MGVRELLLAAAALLHVSVAQEPTLTLMPSGTLLKALDGAVYVSCKAEVEDPALITEMKWSGPNGQEIPNNDGSIITLDNPASPGTLDLYVQKLQEKDVGTYVCTAVYAGNKELLSEIKVESYMDIDFGDTALHQTPIDGTDSKIFCTVTANPTPSVDWLKDMKPIRLDDRHIIQQDGVLIKQISEDDEGVYRCRAKVPELGSIEYKDIKVEVYSPPEIIEAPENITGVEKKGASFNCVASGKPSPTYSWVDKDSRPLEDVEGYNVDTETGTLTVSELGPQHTGTYRCTANNAAGDATKEAYLQVLTKPKIESYLNITVDVEQDVEMRCVATGDPLPELVFKKQSNEAAFINGINEDSRVDISQEVDDQGRAVGVMKIRELQRSDDGLYTCTGNSLGGETQAWGHITAQFIPNFEQQTFTEVWTWDQNPVNLSCIATSIPNATVQWYLRSTEIEAEDTNFQVMSVGPTGVLQVNPVDNHYFGMYTCQATNLLGVKDLDIELKQAEAPDAVSNVKVEKKTATTITWSIMDPNNDGGRPIEGYMMEYRLDDTTWDDAQSHFWTKGSEYAVERLTPDMTYIFRFSARNEVGNSVWGGEQAETMPKRAAPEEPLFSDLGEGVNEIAYPDHYIIQWTTPLDNGEPIDIFQVIHYQMKNVSGKLEKTEDSTTTEIEHPGPTTHKLEDLVPATIYKIELRAHNVIGYSLPAEGIFKTAFGPIPDPSTQSIGMGIIIAIVIIAIIIIAVVIDVSCYFANKAGVLAKILGSRGPKDKDKEAMLEDGKNARRRQNKQRPGINDNVLTTTADATEDSLMTQMQDDDNINNIHNRPNRNTAVLKAPGNRKGKSYNKDKDSSSKVNTCSQKRIPNSAHSRNRNNHIQNRPQSVVETQDNASHLGKNFRSNSTPNILEDDPSFSDPIYEIPYLNDTLKNPRPSPFKTRASAAKSKPPLPQRNPDTRLTASQYSLNRSQMSLANSQITPKPSPHPRHQYLPTEFGVPSKPGKGNGNVRNMDPSTENLEDYYLSRQRYHSLSNSTELLNSNFKNHNLSISKELLNDNSNNQIQMGILHGNQLIETQSQKHIQRDDNLFNAHAKMYGSREIDEELNNISYNSYEDGVNYTNKRMGSQEILSPMKNKQMKKQSRHSHTPSIVSTISSNPSTLYQPLNCPIEFSIPRKAYHVSQYEDPVRYIDRFPNIQSEITPANTPSNISTVSSNPSTLYQPLNCPVESLIPQQAYRVEQYADPVRYKDRITDVQENEHLLSYSIDSIRSKPSLFKPKPVPPSHRPKQPPPPPLPSFGSPTCRSSHKVVTTLYLQDRPKEIPHSRSMDDLDDRGEDEYESSSYNCATLSSARSLGSLLSSGSGSQRSYNQPSVI